MQANVGANSSKLAEHDTDLETMRFKLADMEDRSRRCNVRINGCRKERRDLMLSSFSLKNCRNGSPLLATSREKL